MVRALLFGGARVLAVLFTAIGLGFDASGISPSGRSFDGLRIMTGAAFASFVVLTFWKEVELFLLPRPRIQFDDDGISYASARTRLGELRYFVRLVFKNKAKHPSGDNSTAKGTTARVEIFAGKNSTIVDSWDGRWANTDAPNSYGDIWQKNRYDIPANERAVLDIGFRIDGHLEFQGHDNYQFFSVGSPRKRLSPSTYNLRVTLAASNMKENDFWFSLNIPDDAQSENGEQVKIKPIRKPAIRKGDSQT